MIAEIAAAVFAVIALFLAHRLTKIRNALSENGALKFASEQNARLADFYMKQHEEAAREALKNRAERDEWEVRTQKAIARAAFAERRLEGGNTEQRETAMEAQLRKELTAAHERIERLAKMQFGEVVDDENGQEAI